jgi:hypothetical protein
VLVLDHTSYGQSRTRDRIPEAFHGEKCDYNIEYGLMLIPHRMHFAIFTHFHDRIV